MIAMGRQQKLKWRTWGGKRKGAGRPAAGPRPSEKHQKRPVLKAVHPVHVVLRVAPVVGSLRTKETYLAIREATLVAANHEDCRIVHLSIQRTHIHLICEARNRGALSSGMQGFAISCARKINRAIGRKGKVFPDRFHMRILNSPRRVRNCIAYVLNNWRHHREDRAEFARRWLVDPYSSAIAFEGWKEREGEWKASSEEYRPLVVWGARTWLLSEGWRRHGRIGATEVPGGAVVE